MKLWQHGIRRVVSLTLLVHAREVFRAAVIAGAAAVFPEPVTPEPPFRPFNGYHQLPQTDDTSRPSALSSFLKRLSGRSPASQTPPARPEPEEEPDPEILIRDSLVELQTSLPAKLDISKDAFEHFLHTLSHCREPIAFELFGTEGRVVAQFAAAGDDAPLLRRQLEAYFPEATFIPTQDTLKDAWVESTGDEMFALDFGLEKEFFFPLATGKLDAFIGIVGAMNEFLMPKPISHMLAQPENRLDFGSIMDTGKIFLAKLSKGLVGDKDSHLLGTLIVSKFQQLAMARQSQAASARRNFTLVIDEFADFITPTMAQILTGTRKYRFGLVLGHQELRQLQRNEEVASAVLSSPLTRISFRIGDDDARKLSDGFPHFEARDLQNLGRGEAIMRVERSDYDFNLAVPLLDEPSDVETAERREAVIAASRAKYSRPRTEIEAALRQTIANEPPVEKPAPKTKSAAQKAEPAVPVVAAKVEAPTPVITPKIEAPPVAPVQAEVATPPPSAPVMVVPEQKPVTVSEKKIVPASPGKGGLDHKTIQQQIKEAGQALGFKSEIEKDLNDSQKSADVVLSRGDQVIACEISITNTIENEVGNIAKCLKAGFPKIAFIALDNSKLEAVAKTVTANLGTEVSQRVAYFLPEQFLAYLQKLPKPNLAPSETSSKVAGYKVTRTLPKLTPEEQRQREKIAERAAAEAMRRKPL